MTFAVYDGKLETPVRFPYAVYIPDGYTADMPALFFLHGAGERGNDPEKLCVHGPLYEIRRGFRPPFAVIAPQCPTGRFWQYETAALHAFVQAMTAQYKLQEDRICLTGISMGGYGTWALATRNPELFAAIVPVCGGGMPWAAAQLKQVPVWAFHGMKDTVVVPDESTRMVDAVNRCGGNARITLYPAATHDSWTETYKNPEVWQWLAAQRRTAGM